MKATAIIGANFGDEGKGLMTDYFAAQGDSVVVRFNGGAQAGHTVTLREPSHGNVFHHFGSGTLAGSPTYLSKYFILNPMLFRREYEDLKKKGITPEVYIDSECLVTTPFDMMLNQIIEVVRGDNRHGSCGIGINETIVRHKKIPIYLTDYSDCLPDKFKRILDYIESRLTEFGISEIPGRFRHIFENCEAVIEKFLDDVEFVKNISGGYFFKALKKNIIFEGAQGLLLDEDSRFFPYVTHSKTGLCNVIKLIKDWELDIDFLKVVYVTRCYTTRHGVGPLPFEVKKEILPFFIRDTTNINNEFQGDLRFGYLSLDYLSKTINTDLAENAKLPLEANLAITCLDQIPGNATFEKDGILYYSSIDSFISLALKSIHTNFGYISWGPCRDDVMNYRVTNSDSLLKGVLNGQVATS